MMDLYSHPIPPGEAAAASRAVAIVDSAEGRQLLETVRKRADRFRNGLSAAGLETLPGAHPAVPLMVRDTPRTADLVQHLFDHNVLVTGLTVPVVPRGAESVPVA